MNHSKDVIRVGRIALPYSRRDRGWVTPTGKVIRNPLRAQRAAELINDFLRHTGEPCANINAG